VRSSDLVILRMKPSADSSTPSSTPAAKPSHRVTMQTAAMMARLRLASPVWLPRRQFSTSCLVHRSDRANATITIRPASTVSGSRAISGAPTRYSRPSAAQPAAAASRVAPPACTVAIARARR